MSAEQSFLILFQVQFDDSAGQQHQGRDEPKLGEALDEEVPLWRTLEAGVSRGLEVLHSLQNNLLQNNYFAGFSHNTCEREKE